MSERFTPGPAAPYATGIRYTNSASGDARVGAQFGVVHGSVRIYQYSDEPPAEQFEIGVRNLHAGAPREAEKLMKEAIKKGFAESRAYFYYALALVSGHSISQVVQEQFSELDRVFGMAEQSPHDEFFDALTTVQLLLQSLILQNMSEGTSDDGSAEHAFRLYETLRPELQEYISRHLDMVLTGALEDDLERRESTEIEQHRYDRDRARRAIKFFIPDPAQPRRRELNYTRLSAMPPLLMTGMLGCLLIGYVVLARTTLVFGSRGAWPLVFMIPLFAVPTIWGGIEIARVRAWRARIRRRSEHPPSFQLDPRQTLNQPREQIERFSRFLYDMYESAFRRAAPEDQKESSRWYTATRGIMFALLDDSIWTYSEHEASHPERLDWLIRHHAWETRRAWDNGKLEQWRPIPNISWLRHLAFYAGGIVFIFCIVLLAMAALVANPASALLGSSLIAISAFIWYRANREERFNWLIDRLCNSWEIAAVERQWASEYAAFQATTHFLQDRPSDLEMAVWLDYDTRFIKNEALKQYGLHNRDIVNHLILTEAAGDCLRARVAGGPARYSEYIVKLFLLTENGVRQLDVELNFLAATLGNQNRLSFRYDALASATVREVGVRFAGRNRRVSLLEDDNSESEGPLDAVVMSQSFRLTLVSGTHSDLLIENYSLWQYQLDGEDQKRLIGITLETSGVNAALRILEAVAAEGSDWIRQERARSLRTLKRHVARKDSRLILDTNLRYRPVVDRLGGASDSRRALPSLPSQPDP